MRSTFGTGCSDPKSWPVIDAASSVLIPGQRNVGSGCPAVRVLLAALILRLARSAGMHSKRVCCRPSFLHTADRKLIFSKLFLHVQDLRFSKRGWKYVGYVVCGLLKRDDFPRIVSQHTSVVVKRKYYFTIDYGTLVE